MHFPLECEFHHATNCCLWPFFSKLLIHDKISVLHVEPVERHAAAYLIEEKEMEEVCDCTFAQSSVSKH